MRACVSVCGGESAGKGGKKAKGRPTLPSPFTHPLKAPSREREGPPPPMRGEAREEELGGRGGAQKRKSSSIGFVLGQWVRGDMDMLSGDSHSSLC